MSGNAGLNLKDNFLRNLKWDISLMRAFMWPSMALLMGMSFVLGYIACIAAWHSIPNWENFEHLELQSKVFRLTMPVVTSLIGLVAYKLISLVNQQGSLLMYHESRYTYYFTSVNSTSDIKVLKGLVKAYYREAVNERRLSPPTEKLAVLVDATRTGPQMSPSSDQRRDTGEGPADGRPRVGEDDEPL